MRGRTNYDRLSCVFGSFPGARMQSRHPASRWVWRRLTMVFRRARGIVTLSLLWRNKHPCGYKFVRKRREDAQTCLLQLKSRGILTYQRVIIHCRRGIVKSYIRYFHNITYFLYSFCCFAIYERFCTQNILFRRLLLYRTNTRRLKRDSMTSTWKPTREGILIKVSALAC